MAVRGAYGVLTIKAFAVDARAARRVATENNFIAALYGEGSDEQERRSELWRGCRQTVFIPPPPISEGTAAETPDILSLVSDASRSADGQHLKKELGSAPRLLYLAVG